MCAFLFLAATLSTVACFFWIFQLIFAFLVYDKNRIARLTRNLLPPKITVIIPVFNEPIGRLIRTIFSVKSQHFVETEIIVIDDGSSNPVSFDLPFVKLIRLPTNQGKREAQIVGINASSCDWIVTVDSDTILHSESIYWLYEAAIRENAGAVTGTIYLSNKQENLLTKATACMYWFSFFQERAAQSYFGSMMCCSGGLSIYKKSIIVNNQEKYLTQTFMGQRCVAGDDRHLTNIFLLNKERVCWTPNAIAYTCSPSQFGQFFKQQIRWTRSHVSALWFQLRNINKWSFIFSFLICKLHFRYFYHIFIYTLLIAHCILTSSITPILLCILSVMIISAVKASIAIIYVGDWEFLYLIIYGVLTFLIFNPILLYGVLTPTKTGWLTRSKYNKG